MIENLKVLVSCASNKVPLYRAVKSAASRIDPNSCVISGDLDPMCISAYVSDDFWHMPRIHEDNLQSILEGCIKRRVNIILPTRDGELYFWAKYVNAFAAQGINVITSAAYSIENCIDKLKFSDFGIKKGLPFIPTSEDINMILSPYYVVKERFGSGSHGLGVGLARKDATALASKLVNPIYQPYIQGREFSVDAWVDKTHSVKGSVMRWREVVKNGESQVTKTFSNPKIERIIRSIIESLSLCGPIVLQGILNGSNLHIIECNPRVGGASTAGIAAGVDGLFWSFSEAMGRDVTKCSFQRSQVEIRQVRILSDIYV